MYVNYGILLDTHDDNTLAVIIEALILWGVTMFVNKLDHFKFLEIIKFIF